MWKKLIVLYIHSLGIILGLVILLLLTQQFSPVAFHKYRCIKFPIFGKILFA